MSDAVTGTSEIVYRGRVVTLRVDTITARDGRATRREVVQHRGAVAIVPLLTPATVLLIRQYRHAIGETLLEVPAGSLEVGEEPETCAARELEEEVGYRARRMRPMFGQYLAPGYSSELLHVFLAEDLERTAQSPEDDEEIEVEPTALADVPRLLRDGLLRDAKSIAALLAVGHFLDLG